MNSQEVENINDLKCQVDKCIDELSQRFREDPNSEISEEYDLHYLLADKFLEKEIHKFWEVRWEYNPSHNRKKRPGMLDLAILGSKSDEILIGVEIKFFRSAYLEPPNNGNLGAITKDIRKLQGMKDKKLGCGYLLVFARKGPYEERSSEGRTRNKKEKYLEGMHKLESHISKIKDELHLTEDISTKLILGNKILSDKED